MIEVHLHTAISKSGRDESGQLWSLFEITGQPLRTVLCNECGASISRGWLTWDIDDTEFHLCETHMKIVVLESPVEAFTRDMRTRFEHATHGLSDERVRELAERTAIDVLAGAVLEHVQAYERKHQDYLLTAGDVIGLSRVCGRSFVWEEWHFKG